MKRLATIVGGIALVLAVPAALAQGALDGRKYIGDIGDAGKAADEKGALFTFADGKFNSSVCDKYGFDKGAYTVTKDGDVLRFEAKTVSTEYGTNNWRGRLKGDQLEGVLIWQKKPSFFNKSPEPVEKWFKAKLM
jgi:hypothetical protein